MAGVVLVEGGSTLGGGDTTRRERVEATATARCGHSKVETVFSCLPFAEGQWRGARFQR